MRFRSFVRLCLILLFVSPPFLCSQNNASAKPASEVGDVPGQSLIGTVHLNPDVGAKRYKVKLNQSAQKKYEQTVPSFSPFQFTSIEPGTYDLVIEANGHTTLVKPGFILINEQEVIRINVKMDKAATIFLAGDATKIILCSACHKKIYMEMIRGEGTDFHTSPWPGPGGKLIHLPDLARDFYENSSPKHLAYVAPITVASILKQPEEARDACRWSPVCLQRRQLANNCSI
ncbi:MAG: carboxypeptidase-like regulatory domain-containing protein [Nitrospiria bacterium]